jgi:hypothetical protein
VAFQIGQQSLLLLCSNRVPDRTLDTSLPSLILPNLKPQVGNLAFTNLTS